MAVKSKLELHVDSCGIGWAHLGQRADPRSFEAAKKHSILIDHKAQQFQDHFFDTFDLILTVDEEIAEQLKQRSPQHKDKVHLATAFSRRFKNKEIVDPYYMGASGFDDMMEMVIDACEGLLDHLKKK
jgi:protein-tyrosine phosphatase